jgi:hypothetical protein
MKIYKPTQYPFSAKAESERIDLGFDPKDRRLIDREELERDRIQVLVKDRSDLRITKDNKLEQSQYCSECNAEFTPLPSGKLLCIGCGHLTELDQNIPLTNLKQDLTPHISQLETAENEQAKPFFWSLVDPDGLIDTVDSTANSNFEVVHSSPDGRVQHIKMKPGISPTEYRIIFDR